MTDQQCTGYDDPRALNRRAFLDRFGMGLGGIALAAEIFRRAYEALAEQHLPVTVHRGASGQGMSGSG